MTFLNQVLNTRIDYVHKTITSELVSVSQTASVNYSLWTTNSLGSNLTTGQIQFDVPVLGMNIQVEPK